MDENYPLTDMEKVFNNLHGVKFFKKDDLSDAGHQVEINDEA